MSEPGILWKCPVPLVGDLSLVVSPKGWYWVQYCFNSSVTQTKGQMPLQQVHCDTKLGGVAHTPEGCEPFRRTSTEMGKMGTEEPPEIQKRQMKDHVPGEG